MAFLLSDRLRPGRAFLLVLAAVACIGWGLFSLVGELWPQSTVPLKLGAGSAAARRFQIAENFVAEAGRNRLPMVVLPTKGFEDSMRQVSEGELDFAAVSSGLLLDGCDNIRLVAGLDVAPLHILVRKQLVDAGMSLAEAARGRRVNLGEHGTNDYLLARELLSFLRLNPPGDGGSGDYMPMALSKDELIQVAEDVQALSGPARVRRVDLLPDVVMTVASMPSVITQKLLDTHEYALVPFPYVQNFLSASLERKQAPDGSVDRFYVEPTTISAAMYIGRSPIPERDCPTVGLRTILVTRADMPAPPVKRLMKTVFESEFTRRFHPKTAREIATPFEAHPAVLAYLDRDRPLVTGQLFEYISKFLSIFGAFSAGALSIYGYLRKRRIRRPGEYLEEIRTVDALAAGLQLDEEPSVTRNALVRQLDTRLVKLKEQLIQDYCNNRVQGEMVLMSILSMLADSRTQLRRVAGSEAGTRAGQGPRVEAAAQQAQGTISTSRRAA